MFLSLFLILFGGYLAGRLSLKLKLPALLGMLILGIILSPSCLNWIDPDMLEISPVLRQIALVIIIIRAGLGLQLSDLKKAGRAAIWMCFVPATFEIIGCVLFAPLLLGFSIPESLLLGSVLGAVSPAVVVPGMLKLMDSKRGTREGIPQLILAGASADDIYCLVLFACFSSLAAGGQFDWLLFLRIPTSVLSGIGSGILAGIILVKWFHRQSLDQNTMVIILMALCFLFIWIENQFSGGWFGFSSLMAAAAASMTICRLDPAFASAISNIMNSMWQCAQIFLFVLVGAAVNISALKGAGLALIAVILGAMIFRMAGVFASVSDSKLNVKEKLFCMLAYTPKATVQAAIGAVPLSMGLACGNDILGAAVLAILITAPFGAICIEKASPKLLKSEKIQNIEYS